MVTLGSSDVLLGLASLKDYQSLETKGSYNYSIAGSSHFDVCSFRLFLFSFRASACRPTDLNASLDSSSVGCQEANQEQEDLPLRNSIRHSPIEELCLLQS